MTQPLLRLRFLFDAGAGTCLWSKNEAARARFGYAVELERLPVPEALRHALAALCTEYDSSLNWQDPGAPSPMSLEKRRELEANARSLLQQLQAALGDAFLVEPDGDPFGAPPVLAP